MAVLCLKKAGLNLISLIKAVQSSETRGDLNFHLKNSEQPKEISAWSCKCKKKGENNWMEQVRRHTVTNFYSFPLREELFVLVILAKTWILRLLF